MLERLFLQERLSYREIARRLESTDVTVAAALRRQGIGPSKGTVAPGSSAAAQPTSVHDRRLLQAHYEAGLSARQVAAVTGVPRDRVIVELRKAGVRLRGRGARPADSLDAPLVRQQYEQGASLRELAVRHRTDDRHIKDALAQAGASIRRRGAISRFEERLTPAFLHHRYVAERASAAEIAREVGCSTTTVREALRRHRVERP